MLRNQPLSYVGVAVGVIVALCLLSTKTFADEKKSEPDAIWATDLFRKVAVIGKLELPIGEVVTVRGKWRLTKSETEKWQPGCFEITEINGKLLETPVSFSMFCTASYLGKKPLKADLWDGDTWELRGFETGGLEGIPNKALKEIGCPIQPFIKYRFSSYFSYYKAFRVCELNAKNKQSLPTSSRIADEHKSRPLRTVTASDLISRVPVIGKLNRPMGTIVTIRGKYVDISAPNAPTWHGMGFRVTHIDGMKLANAIDYHSLELLTSVFTRSLLSPVFAVNLKTTLGATVMDGDEWELKGYEGGHLFDMPHTASREQGRGTYIFPGGQFPFTMNFRYFKARRFRE